MELNLSWLYLPVNSGRIRDDHMNKFLTKVPVCIMGLIWFLLSTYTHAQGSAPWVYQTLSGAPCQGQQGLRGVGPFDYLNRAAMVDDLNIVEKFHFFPAVEQLTEAPKSLAQNLDYTLRAWPNHHRALNAMMRFQLRESKALSTTLSGLNIPPTECYFFRAINYSPKDANTRMLFAIYLHRKNKYELAYTRYSEALELAPQDIQLKYNFALLLVDMKEFERAKLLAQEVYSRNYPLQGLKRKLERLGYW